MILHILLHLLSTTLDPTKALLSDVGDAVIIPREKYASLRECRCFADKSDLLGVLFDDQFNSSSPNSYYFVTSPRGMGKTTAFDMIREFSEMKFTAESYHKSIAAFMGCKIGSRRRLVAQNANKYAVIWITFEDILQNVTEESQIVPRISHRLNESISSLLWTHSLIPYLNARARPIKNAEKPPPAASSLKEDLTLIKSIRSSTVKPNKIENALYVILKRLYESTNNTRVVLLVDDYDDAALRYLEDVPIPFIRHFYQILHAILRKALVDGRKYIKFALITAIGSLPYTMPNSLKNLVPHYQFLEEHDFTPHYGLSLENVEKVFDNGFCLGDDIFRMKSQYAPYYTTTQRLVYNTFQISQILQTRWGEYFWCKYHFNSTWKNLEKRPETAAFFKNHYFREAIFDMVNKTQVEYEVKKTYPDDAFEEFVRIKERNYDNTNWTHASMYFTMFFDLGYVSHDVFGENYTFSYPNPETKSLIYDLFDIYEAKYKGSEKMASQSF